MSEHNEEVEGPTATPGPSGQPAEGTVVPDDEETTEAEETNDEEEAD